MRDELLDILCCPLCKTDLRLTEAFRYGGEIEAGVLTCAVCGREFSVTESIPRFVAVKKYADSFGFQWNQFRRTQLDSHSGVPISRDRFFQETGWLPEELYDRWVLDVGCGAGRFAEIALSCGARVIALDYSGAVDACRENLQHWKNLDVVQGDIYHLPIKMASMDYVYCFGVLQHTPNVRGAFMALPGLLRDGGRLAVDVYAKSPLNLLWSKYWIRLVTRRLPPRTLVRIVRGMVQTLFPVSLRIGRIPRIGRRLRYLIPVANYDGVLPLSSGQLREWAVLDTFDMLAARYDKPQSVDALHRWFHAAGLSDIEVFRRGLVVGRGTRK